MKGDSMADEELDYENDRLIDPDQLDVEWLEQNNNLEHKYNKVVARLRAELEQLEEKKKIKRSELIDKVNRAPQETVSKDKPNASDIEAFYRRDPEYQQIAQDIIDKQYELEMAENAKNEIIYTRKRALEYLAQLHHDQYFAGPSVPRNLSEEWQRRQGQANKVAKSSKVSGKKGMKRG